MVIGIYLLVAVIVTSPLYGWGEYTEFRGELSIVGIVKWNLPSVDISYDYNGKFVAFIYMSLKPSEYDDTQST